MFYIHVCIVMKCLVIFCSFKLSIKNVFFLKEGHVCQKKQNLTILFFSVCMYFHSNITWKLYFRGERDVCV